MDRIHFSTRTDHEQRVAIGADSVVSDARRKSTEFEGVNAVGERMRAKRFAHPNLIINIIHIV